MRAGRPLAEMQVGAVRMAVGMVMRVRMVMRLVVVRMIMVVIVGMIMIVRVMMTMTMPMIMTVIVVMPVMFGLLVGLIAATTHRAHHSTSNSLIRISSPPQTWSVSPPHSGQDA